MCLVYNYCRPLRRNIHEALVCMYMYTLFDENYPQLLGVECPRRNSPSPRRKDAIRLVVRLYMFGYGFMVIPISIAHSIPIDQSHLLSHDAVNYGRPLSICLAD